MRSLGLLCGFALVISLGCEESAAEPATPDQAVVRDGRAIAGVLATDEAEEPARRAEVLLLERRGVLAGETMREEVVVELLRVNAALEALTLHSEPGRAWREQAVAAYEARVDALRRQAELLEATDAEGWPYLEAIQDERTAVIRVGAVSGAIEELGTTSGD